LKYKSEPEVETLNDTEFPEQTVSETGSCAIAGGVSVVLMLTLTVVLQLLAS